MTKINKQKIKNNAYQFDYFPNEPEKDWVPLGGGIYCKPTFVKYPYLAQDNNLFKLDITEHINISAFDFIIQENQGEIKSLDQIPHNFVISENLKEFSSGTTVFEIRTKNCRGQWQSWQAILGEFKVYKILSAMGKNYLQSPIEDELEYFKEHFEIRYSGILKISHLNEVQIIGDDMIKTFSTNTRLIEFFPDSNNTCLSLEDKFKSWNDFIDKYHCYDSNGNRI